MEKKRAVKNPANAYVELLVVTDYSIYLAHQQYANSSNATFVLLQMKIYFAHLIYAVFVLTDKINDSQNIRSA
jgi:hypothetical protein